MGQDPAPSPSDGAASLTLVTAGAAGHGRKQLVGLGMVCAGNSALFAVSASELPVSRAQIPRVMNRRYRGRHLCLLRFHHLPAYLLCEILVSGYFYGPAFRHRGFQWLPGLLCGVSFVQQFG